MSVHNCLRTFFTINNSAVVFSDGNRDENETVGDENGINGNLSLATVLLAFQRLLIQKVSMRPFITSFVKLHLKLSFEL